MANFNGRSGADAIFKALHRICIVVQRFGPKLNLAIDLTAEAALITSEQATAAKAFITSSGAVCDIFNVVARNSGFSQTGEV